jgi:hypothetical protein
MFICFLAGGLGMSSTIGIVGPAPYGQLFINSYSSMCLVPVERRADGFAMRGGVDAEGVVVLRMVHHERHSVWWSRSVSLSGHRPTSTLTPNLQP